MKTKMYNSKEAAEKALNYLVVNVDVIGVCTFESFTTKAAANNNNDKKLNGHGRVMTRKQFEKFKKENPELIF